MKGKLYGVGVGPGDPSLITLKAVEVLQRSRAVFVPRSKKDRPSVALSIARGHLQPDTAVVELDLPMTGDRKTLETAWDQAAGTILKELARLEEAAFLTLGDPSMYSTFGYVAQKIRSLDPRVEIQVVPGITSFAAAAARTGVSLAEQDQPLVILPAAESDLTVPALKSRAGVVILKASRGYGETLDLLARHQRLPGALLYSRVGLPDETVTADLAAVTAPDYLSLIIIRPKEEEA